MKDEAELYEMLRFVDQYLPTFRSKEIVNHVTWRGICRLLIG